MMAVFLPVRVSDPGAFGVPSGVPLLVEVAPKPAELVGMMRKK